LPELGGNFIKNGYEFFVVVGVIVKTLQDFVANDLHMGLSYADAGAVGPGS
jgi:hypothetical protein